MTNHLNQIVENRLLEGWIRFLGRHPDQVNQPHETDAELIALPGMDHLIALSIDTVSEEIVLGFYPDPYSIGWMGATVTLSDLAAVGACPVGLLVSVTLPEDATPEFQQEIAAGLNDACRRVDTYILGGDTNFGPTPAVTTSGIGLVERDRVLKRIGCRPGDLLYATGRLGTGGPVAAKGLWGIEVKACKKVFRPLARVKESQVIRDHASACMDSSDGLIATLDQLVRLNNIGFELTRPLEEVLDPEALQVCAALDLDPLIMLAQPHGEFELVFTVPAAEQENFERCAGQQEAGFLLLGEVITEPLIQISNPVSRIVESTRIRNLLHKVNGDLQRYREELITLVEVMT